MSGWTAAEVDEIGAADDLEIAPSRPDGTRYPDTTMWVVRVGDNVYVRSYWGTDGKWFRHALEHPEGHIRAGGVARDVAFEHANEAENDGIDEAATG
jgi:hypothetical protein